MQFLTLDQLRDIYIIQRNDLTCSRTAPIVILVLIEFSRTSVRFVGGCGACVVMVSRYDPRTKNVEEITVNSCLTLLCSLDGCAVTTTEGLGNQQAGHHAIHKRMSGFHASQCGFCTPGMTMALYGTLRKSGSKSCNKPEANGACNLPLTAAEAERAIAGNICRCTGYRPLLDTCKSFCADVDVEDLGMHQFQNKNELPVYDSTRDPVFPPFLVEECEARETSSHDNHNVESAQSMILSLRFCHNAFQ